MRVESRASTSVPTPVFELSELLSLLRADSPASQAHAWEVFVDGYSRVILHAVRSVYRETDAAMDCYAFVLEKLRENDFRRLRTFSTDGAGKFTTWLVVVTRRLANDWHRQRYGRRTRGDEDDLAREERAGRRRLVDLTAEAIELAELPDHASVSPETELLSDELQSALLAEIEALDPSDRLLIKLRFEDELTARDIAAITHAGNPFHVYRQLNRILATLKRGLIARGVESSSA
jgi:RNA polymerase sigma factor (sigma-70 family)